MKITEKQKQKLNKYFYIHNDENELSLESWSIGGVDMWIYLDKKSDDSVVAQLEDYINNFDIDEEIEIYREDEEYKEVFTISESLKDFENWIEWIKNIINELKDL